ncbi:lamin tail domain-containing protein [Amycolatopsis sp. NPDC049868]|uniref:lamin tail domain-containing protein n=1 Tax=Amycolatopsis sp. NPDC049868 TaxID=3363934 RepID=UPI0037A0B082
MIRKLVSGVLGVLVLSLVTAPSSDARDLAPQVSTTVLINEVFPQGPNGALDEFLELRNVSTAPVDLTGFSLRFYSSTCVPTQTLILPQALVVQPMNSMGQFVVLLGRDFSGTIYDPTNVVPVGTSVDLLPARTGSVVLLDSTGRQVDTVGWAPPLETPCLREGQPARTPPPGLSLSRNYLSWDTDNNRCDFSPTPPTTGARWPEPPTKG